MESLNRIARKVFILFLLFFALSAQAQLTTRGFIVDNKGDTIETTIWKNKKKKQDYKRNFSRITIIDSLGKEIILSPNQITGYSKDNIYYLSIRPKDRTPFFVKNITYGKVELYYFKRLEIYLFKKNTEKQFYVIDTELDEDPVFSETAGITPSDINPHFINPMQPSEEEFRLFFSSYFGDCSLISNKVQSLLYKYNDIEVMFKHYNDRCE